ncbi:peptide deformylase [Candidatus Saccharibacteria bacterium]|nr:peptide deformylase [Candidatus Saccharibacteria bacterium]
MKIITTPDRRLRERSEKVGKIDDETREIIAEMRKLSLEWEKEHPYELSAAMAAPQMGVNKRIIIIRDDMNDKKKATFTALIDPVVIRAEGKMKKDYEGCLSVPKYYGLVPRPTKVRVKAKLEDGTEVRIKANDDLARTLLHEIDHLDGVLFIDHIKDDKEAFFIMNNKGDLEPVDYDKEIAGNTKLWGEE